MPTGRPMAPLELSGDEFSQLPSLAGSRTLPHSIVQREQIVLACAAGDTNTAVAKRFAVRGSTVGEWRQRYLDLGIEGLHDELRPDWPRTCEDDKVAELVNRVLQTQPTDGQHPVLRALLGGCHRDLQDHGSPMAADLLAPAQPAEIVRALNRAILCGEGPRHRWPVSEPTG